MKEFVLISTVLGSMVICFFAIVILYGIFFEMIPNWGKAQANKACTGRLIAVGGLALFAGIGIGWLVFSG